MPHTTEQRPALDLPPAPPAAPAPRRRRRTWLWPLLAFGLGVVAFGVVLMGRGSKDFYRAGAPASDEAGREYAPLPAPAATEGSETIGLQRDIPDIAPEEAPRVVPPPVHTPAVPAPAPRPVTREFVQARPLPGRSPAPSYPAQALRNGDEGTVNVRVQVGPDGVPTSVSLVSGSGSRLLDRAAQDAVRRWRFQPAMLNGQPTVSSVVVPIDFSRE